MIPLLLTFACQSPPADQAPATARSGHVLQLEAQVTESEGEQIFTFILDEARVSLTLSAPDIEKPPMISGPAILESHDPEHGARFVAALVQWLGEPDPPLGNAHPGPWRLRYALLSEAPTWTVYKLLFKDADGQAELLLRTYKDSDRAEILRKEGGDSSEVARLAAVALRDGPEVGAWIPSSTALRGSEHLVSARWCGDGLIAVAKIDGGHSLRLWKDLRGQPEEISTGEGRPGILLPDPTCARAALAVDYPADPEAYDSADPTEILVVDLATGKTQTLSSREETWTLQEAAWSPDGGRVALTTIYRQGEAPFPGVTRVYDAVNGEVLATADPEWDALPWRWGETLMLRTDPFNRRSGQPSWYRWSIDTPATPSEPPVLTSPDHTQTLDQRNVNGADPYLVQWVGPHHALLVSDAAVVKDLSDGKTQPFHTLGGVRGLAVDDDGSRIALLTRTGIRWAATPK